MDRTAFEELNKAHANQRTQMLEHELKAQEFEAKAARWDADTISEICDTMDDITGKPAFSNAERRNAELAVRQLSNPLRTELNQSIHDHRRATAFCRIEAELLHNSIKFTLTSQDPADAQLMFHMGPPAEHIQLATSLEDNKPHVNA